MENNNPKNIWFDNIEIRDGLCSCFKARVLCKRFGYTQFIHNAGDESNDISMTHTKVLEFYREATKVQYRGAKSNKEDSILQLTLNDYEIFVVLKERKQPVGEDA